jgi:hypothetical protein
MGSEPFERDRSTAEKAPHPLQEWAVGQMDDPDSIVGWVLIAAICILVAAIALFVLIAAFALALKFGQAIGAWGH